MQDRFFYEETKLPNRKLLENVYLIPGFTNIGVINTKVNGKNKIYLVDSGPSSKSAIEISIELKNIFPEGFEIFCVINTHGHSDHVGGNNFFQNMKAEIWIPKKETLISINGHSNVDYIWGGDAIPELKGWYSLKESFSATRFIKSGEKIVLPDENEISFIDLHGHSEEQVGILYKNKKNESVLFSGDAYLGLDELYKSAISFQEAPLDALSTMKKLKETKADFFIQSHGLVPATQDEAIETIDGNIRSLEKTIAYINYILKRKSLTTEEIVSKIIGQFDIHIKAVNFALVYSTVKSLLSELHEKNEISAKIKNGFFLWTKKQK